MRKFSISIIARTLLAMVIPVNVSAFVQPLSSWEVRRVNEGKAEEWIPAKVPSTVAVAYRDAGLLPDIRYDDNVLRADDSWYVADFEYRTTFAKPFSNKDGERVILNFDGISWKADVTLNGEPVGRIEGSFIRSRFDVTGLLRENNTLAVLIHHQAHPGEVKIPTLEKPVPNGGILGADNPCFHASIGWDWLPPVPGRNIGIWNDVYLSVADDGVVVEDAFFDTVLGKTPEYAIVYPTITVNNFSNKVVEKTMEIKFGDIPVSQKVAAAPGRTDIVLEPFRVNNPELWWPNGYGEPHLYDVSVRFGSSVKSLRCGIRQMFYTLENNALQMYINGRRFIPKGGNWGFSDINLEFTKRQYDIAMKFHRMMNFNMVRNWVGQVGDDEFYEACDEAGIMVWQDFWLANPADGPDPDDSEMFVKNASDMVHRVRPHACLALFCARNEGIPKRPLELHLNRIVADLCPHSLYIVSSSEYIVSGQGPYRNHVPANYFRNYSTAVDDIPVGDNKFHSERGAPCIPSYESMCRMFRPEHRWPQNDVWALHNFTLGGAQHCATLNEMISRGFGAEPVSLKEFADRAQYINYNTYRAMFESRSSHRNGLLLWMSHPAWPCLVFQTYDYWFDVNAATYACKRGAAPIRIQWNPLLSTIEVVNDSYGDVKGLTARVSYLDAFGNTLADGTYALDSGDDTTVRVCDFKVPAGVDLYYVKLVLTKEGKTIADNFYWEGKEPGVWTAIPSPEKNALKTNWTIGDGSIAATVTNTGKTVIPMVRIDLMSRKSKKEAGSQVLPSFYEDNYFALLPGESREIRIEYMRGEHQGETFSVSARALR